MLIQEGLASDAKIHGDMAADLEGRKGVAETRHAKRTMRHGDCV